MSSHLYLLFGVLFLVLIPLRVTAWSWRPLQRTSYCSFLDDIEVIYHLGDYLLLSVTPSLKQQPGHYYMYNWKSGHMFGQPLEQAQLFGQLDSPKEGRLLFATTFDMCSLQLDSRPRRRRKRQFDLATDLGSFGFGAAEETTFEKRKAAIMQEMESKLAVLQQDNKKELAKAVIDLKHQLTSLGNSLLLSQAQQRLVLSSMVMRRPEENPKKKADPAEPVASTTLSPEMVVHEEMMARLEALHKNLSDLTSNLKPSTVAEATAAQVQSLPPPVGATNESPSGALSAVNERSFGDLSLPSPPCPTVILATFTTSEYNWEGRICGDRRSPWLKSYLYEYQGLSQTQPPNLTPMMLDEVSFTNLLTYRGRVHLHEETSTFVLVRNDLACPMEDSPQTDNKLLAGFRLHERMFVQMKKGVVQELANSRYLEEVSISELLNCYGNSSLFTEPFTILGGAPMMPYPINPLTNSEENENEDDLGRPSAKLRTAGRKEKKRIQEEDSQREDDNREIRDRDDVYNFGNFKKKNRRQEPRDGQNRRGLTSPNVLTRPDKMSVSSSFPPERNGPFGPRTNNGGYDQSAPVGRSVDTGRGALHGQIPPQGGVVMAPLGGSVSVRDNAENQRQQQEAKKKYMFYAGGALLAIVGYCCFCTSSAEQIELQKRRQRKSQRKGRKHKRKKKRMKGKTKSKSKKFKRQRKEDSDEDDGDDFDLSRASKRGRSRNVSRSRQRQESKRQSRLLRQSLQSQAGNSIVKQQSVQLTPQVLAQSYAPPPQVYQARAPVLTSTLSGSVNDPNEVIVLDADKVQQFCATDADMASRFESMFGESKLIAQLMDVKRQLGEGQLPQGLELEPPACLPGTPSSLERMNANSSSLSLSPALSTKEQSTNYTSEDESMRLIEVLHRLRKSLSSKTNADMPSR